MSNICWTKENKDSCIESMNRFEDQQIKGHDIQPHYQSFNELLSLCRKEYEKPLLLDIGTGSGRIGQFCKDFHFFGSDLQWIIDGVAMRNYPHQIYFHLDIENDELAKINRFDVLVLNGVIDVMQEPLKVLKRILTYAKKYVLIHRQEITEGESHTIMNDSYGSQTYHSIINRGEWNQLLEEMGFEIVLENSPGFKNWTNGGSSFLLKNKNWIDTRYDSHPLRQLRNRIQQANPLKVVIGAGDQPHDPEWICTNVEELDVENEEDFKFLFGDKKADNFLAEHVWEHLSHPNKAAANCYRYLKDGGKLRIAVPDGFHPDKEYIDAVKVGGNGAGSDDHKMLWDYQSLGKLLIENADFNFPQFIEYWDEKGAFHKADWLHSDGFIGRSAEYDERNIGGKLVYTSLILDAIK